MKRGEIRCYARFEFRERRRTKDVAFGVFYSFLRRQEPGQVRIRGAIHLWQLGFKLFQVLGPQLPLDTEHVRTILRHTGLKPLRSGKSTSSVTKLPNADRN